MGQPPEEYQFKKGQSGNLKGRPKKVRNVAEETAVSKIVNTTFQGRKDGEVRELTAKEFAERSIFNSALSGNKAARRRVMSWITKRDGLKARKRRRQKQAVPGKYQIETVDPRNADIALQLLNITCINEERSDRDSDYIQFELLPDAVLAALKRLRGRSRLTKDKLDWLLAYTKDGESIDLPKRYKS